MYIKSNIPNTIPKSDVDKASTSYLISLVVMFVGLPMPIFNLLVSIIFYYVNRKASPFVKWHCTQALLIQMTLFLINTSLFWWTLSIMFSDTPLSNAYFSYFILIALINIIQIIQMIISTSKIKKNINIHWWIYGGITDMLIKNPIHEKND